jgi:hypothetical protein
MISMDGEDREPYTIVGVFEVRLPAAEYRYGASGVDTTLHQGKRSA